MHPLVQHWCSAQLAKGFRSFLNLYISFVRNGNEPMYSTVKAAQQLSKEVRHLLTSEQRSKIHSASSEILKIEDKSLRDLLYSG